MPPSSGVILIDKSTTPTTNNTTTVDIGTEPIDDLHEIIADYERRLQEQVALARQDVLRELEVQIQVSIGHCTHFAVYCMPLIHFSFILIIILVSLFFLFRIKYDLLLR